MGVRKLTVKSLGVVDFFFVLFFFIRRKNEERGNPPRRFLSGCTQSYLEVTTLSFVVGHLAFFDSRYSRNHSLEKKVTLSNPKIRWHPLQYYRTLRHINKEEHSLVALLGKNYAYQEWSWKGRRRVIAEGNLDILLRMPRAFYCWREDNVSVPRTVLSKVPRKEASRKTTILGSSRCLSSCSWHLEQNDPWHF